MTDNAGLLKLHLSASPLPVDFAATLRTILLLLLLLPLCQSCGPTYSCPANSHCYGQISLSDSVTLIRLQLDTPQLIGGDGHISDEVWLVQGNNPACSGTDENGLCWVEVGVCAGNSGCSGGDPTTTHFFWAEAPPNGNFNFHDLGVVPSQQFGQRMIVGIAKLPGPDQPNSIFAFVEPGLLYGGVSTGNTMTPTTFQFGLELFGTMGASATDAHFTNIYVMDGNGGAYLGGSTTSFWNGVVTDNSPVVADWEITPDQSMTGGKFHTALP
jgi:hypothetical protein